MVSFTQKDRYNAADLLQIVALLRAPGGCPWDREQTHQSIRMNFIEETYEAVEAIDLADPHLLCEELGDVLLQVALHCQIEAEQGVFSFEDVCDGICKKLIYRHPHVFGDTVAQSTGEVLRNWNALKNKEKGRDTAKAELESVPACLPALMRAAKVQKRAAGYGFAYKTIDAALADLESELAELREALRTGQNLPGEAGDVLFSAVNVARMAKVDAEQALGAATGRFTARVAACEDLAAGQGKALKDLSADELDELWRKAKQALQSSENRDAAQG